MADRDSTNVPSAGTATIPARPRRPEAARPSVGELLERIGDAVPEEVWRQVPTDLSGNLDHYLYGAPRK